MTSLPRWPLRWPVPASNSQEPPNLPDGSVGEIFIAGDGTSKPVGAVINRPLFLLESQSAPPGMGLRRAQFFCKFMHKDIDIPLF